MPSPPPTPLDPAPRSYPDAVTLWGRKPPPRPAPRPESAASIETWLLGPALELDVFLDAFHAFVWRLAAAPFDVDRASVHVGTLHPEIYGYAWNWSRLDGLVDEVRVAPDVLETDAYRRNPLYQVIEAGVRVRAVPAEAADTVGLMADLAAEGFTDYVALPLNAVGAQHNAATLATRRPGGFSLETLTTLDRLLAIFALHVERHIQQRIAANALAAYLGPAAGAEVLAGSIRRGDGRAIQAVVWCSDLRGFTDLSARLSGPDTTVVLNAYFERLAGAVSTEGGEVLKFVGDGLLAVFPYECAASALAAAKAGLAAVARLGED
ncbi:MAG: adenylate/guanylate cyclase domain-containing protein, partial [Alphaproteobacteria bacterium]